MASNNDKITRYEIVDFVEEGNTVAYDLHLFVSREEAEEARKSGKYHHGGPEILSSAPGETITATCQIIRHY